MKGSANCCLDNVGAIPPVRRKKYGDRAQNRRGGAPEGAPAVHSAGGAPSLGALTYCAVPALRLPQGRQKRLGRKPGNRARRAEDPRACAARSRKRAPISTSSRKDDMRAFGRKAAIPRRNDGSTDQQRAAFIDEVGFPALFRALGMWAEDALEPATCPFWSKSAA
jgi:hypothetical protein